LPAGGNRPIGNTCFHGGKSSPILFRPSRIFSRRHRHYRPDQVCGFAVKRLLICDSITGGYGVAVARTARQIPLVQSPAYAQCGAIRLEKKEILAQWRRPAGRRMI